MAFWNAPLDDPDHARHACEAALAMIERLEALNAALREEAGNGSRPPETLRVGIGINTGDCCVGNLGSEQRFDYSAIGDEVNLASRLEGQSKAYGVDVIVGENTRREVPDLATLELDLVRVKGKGEAVRIHALLGGPQTAERREFRELCDRHGELIRAYRARDWATALARIEDCRSAGFGLEPLYALYRERVEGFQANPPVPGWAGVHEALSK
jgi:adenylate cyclase